MHKSLLSSPSANYGEYVYIAIGMDLNISSEVIMNLFRRTRGIYRLYLPVMVMSKSVKTFLDTTMKSFRRTEKSDSSSKGMGDFGPHQTIPVLMYLSPSPLYNSTCDGFSYHHLLKLFPL